MLKALADEKELSQLKSNFVAMVSHEFRTPLGIIHSSADILAAYFDRLTPEERLSHLTSIRKNSRRMADLMEEVLVLSRFDSGRMHFEPTPLDLPNLCARLADEVAESVGRQCPIALRLPAVVPRAQGDEKLLRHILLNVLSNAVKYSAPGSEVTFEFEVSGGNGTFRISDQGIGIAEEDQRWLFEPFYRGRNVGQRAGTGLGLAIVKRCVALHGGQVDLISRPGEGTQVSIHLPLFPQP